jgi:hypothetical protein
MPKSAEFRSEFKNEFGSKLIKNLEARHGEILPPPRPTNSISI